MLRWLWSLARQPGPARPGSGARSPRLVVLRHHRVYADDARPIYRLGVSERVLRKQLSLLRTLGLGPVTVKEGLDWLASGRAGTRVAVSFDDGYADNVERALPLLQEVGGRATFYLTAGLIERRMAPWWDQLDYVLAISSVQQTRWETNGEGVELDLTSHDARQDSLSRLLPLFRLPPTVQGERLASLFSALQVTGRAPCELATWEAARALEAAGMEIGAHTLSHPFLDLLDAADQEDEIRGSIDLIEQRLKRRPVGLAYPGGCYDARSIQASRSAGLDYAVTTRAGDIHPEAPRFELRRRGMYEAACLGPGGRFSTRMVIAELDGAFDGLREARAGVAS